MNIATEAIWIHNLMDELGLPQKESSTIYCDNQSMIRVVHKLVAHSKTKHIEVHAHYLEQWVQEGVIFLENCTTDDQVVDYFTKLLIEATFAKFWSLLVHQEGVIKGGLMVTPPS